MSKIEVQLDDHCLAFAKAQVREGRYDSIGEVVQAGLRLLEEREARIAALRQALVEGERSGPSKPFDFDTFVARRR